MPNYIFGEIENVKEGDFFEDRLALRNAKIHFARQSGIDGNSKVGSPSIVLNGGYVDDIDNGDLIYYTGHGGRGTNNKQIADQLWSSPGNNALLLSEIHNQPIRVTRGSKSKSIYSPKKGLRYDGLYRIVTHKQEIGVDGFKICRYILEKINDTTNLTNFTKEPSDRQPIRTPSIVNRINRDYNLSIKFKEKYKYRCQICDLTIAIHDIKYAEAAHVKPLGMPHNGNDSENNLLCLCPNHHVMLDKGIISINDDLSLLGMSGNIKLITYDLDY